MRTARGQTGTHNHNNRSDLSREETNGVEQHFHLLNVDGTTTIAIHQLEDGVEFCKSVERGVILRAICTPTVVPTWCHLCFVLLCVRV